jgi:RNA polymerase primary sigma factor
VYFRDIARVAVLRPREEFEMARKLEALEVATWARLLSSPPLTGPVLARVAEALAAVEGDLEEPEALGALRDAARAARGRRGRAFDETVLAAAEALRALDRDKLALEQAIAALDEDARAFARPAGLARHLRSVHAAQRRAQRAKNEFVQANLRLVVTVARRFNFGRMPLADLIQEGNLGLVKAVDRFDHRRGYRFSTYASWWIRHAISRALADKSRAVRVPVHLLDSQHRVARARRELSSRFGREPTTDELHAATGVAKETIERLPGVLSQPALSLDEAIGDGEDEGRRYGEVLQDPNADARTIADLLADRALVRELRDELARLKPIEAEVLRRRFGLDRDEEQTLREIGDDYSLSRERIRQIQERALTKLRSGLKRRDLI